MGLGARSKKLLAVLLNAPDARVSSRDPRYRAYLFDRSKTIMQVSILAFALIYAVSTAIDVAIGYPRGAILITRIFILIPCYFGFYFLSLTKAFERRHQALTKDFIR